MNNNLKTLIALTCAVIFAACAGNPTTENKQAVSSTEPSALQTIPFTPAKNYFVNNNVSTNGLCVVNSSNDLSALLGMATVMGPNGKPTLFNPETQTLLAYILPETDTATNIEPVRVEIVDSNTLQLCCRITRGDSAMSYRIRPFSAVIIEKQKQQNVRFLQVEK